MSEPIRVLHLVTSLEQGGAEAMLANLVRDGGDAIDHHVCTMMAAEPFFRVDEERFHAGPSRRGRLDPALVRHVRRIVRQVRPRVVHAWMYHANLASVLALGSGARIVWSIHNTHLVPGEAKATTRLVNRGCAVLSRIVPSAIVYVSQAARRLHEAQGYASDRGIVVPNGVDLARFSPAAALPDPRIAPAPGRRVLGMVARFEAGKGHEFLVDAVAADARLRETLHLVFVGRSCTAPRLRERLAAAGLLEHATLLEAQPDIERVYAACDAIVLPSFGEAFPMTVIEAAAMGKPVVASRVGDVPLIGLPESHLFDAGDAAGCVRALETALVDPPGHADAQRAIAERFGIESVRRRYAALYRKIAEGSDGRPAS